MTGVASVRQRASRLAGGIPRGAPSAGAAVGALERAVTQLNAAAEQLATFSQRADGFAQRLVMGASPQSLALARAREDAENAYAGAGDSGASAALGSSDSGRAGVRRLTAEERESHERDMQSGRLVESGADAQGERYLRPSATLTDLLVAEVRASGRRDFEGYLGRLNPLHDDGLEWQNNCGPCARAFADTLHGVETRVAPGDSGLGELSEMRVATGTNPPALAPSGSESPEVFTARAWAAVATGAADLPAGTVLIVGVDWASPSGGGHWFNAVVEQDGLKWVNSQDGSSGPWPPRFQNSIVGIDAIQRPDGYTKWKAMDL